MQVNLTTPISVIITSGLLIQEDSSVGTIQFKINDQPVSLAINKTDYTYDTVFAENDRVKLNKAFGAFAVDSEGVLKSIIIDPTDDQGDVFFDTIYPNQMFNSSQILDVEAGDLSVLVRVPLNYLDKI